MHRRWLLAFAILSGCHKLFSLTEVPDVPDAPPTPVEDCARDVSAGRDFTCAIDRPGTVWCWGLNDTGQVSPGGPRHVLAPSPISLPAPATQVAAGRKFACARLEDGTAWCWGHNGAGQLGSGTSGDVGPLEVPLEAIDEIRTGGHHACARLQSDGTIWCWGENRNFATAQPTTGGTTPPVAVAGTEGSKRLILAHRHGCAIGPDDRLRCWGRNDRNQLGVTGPSSPELRTPELGPVVDAARAARVAARSTPTASFSVGAKTGTASFRTDPTSRRRCRSPLRSRRPRRSRWVGSAAAPAWTTGRCSVGATALAPASPRLARDCA